MRYLIDTKLSKIRLLEFDSDWIKLSKCELKLILALLNNEPTCYNEISRFFKVKKPSIITAERRLIIKTDLNIRKTKNSIYLEDDIIYII